MGRLRVHSSKSMENKIFVVFIDLIIMSHMHRVMSEKGLVVFTNDDETPCTYAGEAEGSRYWRQPHTVPVDKTAKRYL